MVCKILVSVVPGFLDKESLVNIYTCCDENVDTVDFGPANGVAEVGLYNAFCNCLGGYSQTQDAVWNMIHSWTCQTD